MSGGGRSEWESEKKNNHGSLDILKETEWAQDEASDKITNVARLHKNKCENALWISK